MEALLRDGGTTIVIKLDDSRLLGRGVSARIYPVLTQGYETSVAKLYRDPTKTNIRKLRAMLENPPSIIHATIAGRRYPQYAWPTHLLFSADGEVIGYLMPLVDEHESLTLDFFYDQHLLQFRNLPDEQSLTFKLEVGRNLCGLLADLHAPGHCVIDFKPQNIKVFKRLHIVTLLDCDSYRITDKAKGIFPATHYTSEYIAPEALRNGIGPEGLSEYQDRFALAVVLFQLLNNGIHPFQGIQSKSVELPSNDDKVREGFYPYGVKPHPAIQPPRQSIHHCFDDTIHAMFDRAFMAERPSERPNALAWREHLSHLLSEKHLQRCDRCSTDPAHIHFLGKPCGACHFEAIVNEAKPPPPRPWPWRLIVTGAVVIMVLITVSFYIWSRPPTDERSSGSNQDPVIVTQRPCRPQLPGLGSCGSNQDPVIVTAQGNPQVWQAQKCLKAAGFDPGPIDGILGRRTSEALRQYQVWQAQERLKAAGFDPGPIDGILGPLTEEALRQYQAAHGLPVTEELDEATETSLDLDDCGVPRQ